MKRLSEEIEKSIEYEEANMFFAAMLMVTDINLKKHLNTTSYAQNVVNL